MKSTKSNSLPADRAARVYLTVPQDDVLDAKMLGCDWDRAVGAWWMLRDSVIDTPYVWRWMGAADPLTAKARAEYSAQEQKNKRGTHRNRWRVRH